MRNEIALISECVYKIAQNIEAIKWRLPAEAQGKKESKEEMKNPKGLKCFVCDMETGIKIFNYKGYIEYFRNRKKMKNKRKISALDEKYFNDNNLNSLFVKSRH